MRDTPKRLVDFPGGCDVANDYLLPAGGRLCFAQCRLIVLRIGRIDQQRDAMG